MSADADRPEPYRRFARPVPAWFTDAKLGIFVHWGAYSVPAWAKPIGPLGAFEPEWWFAHNPYAEWYFNTIRIEGSPARAHQLATYGDLDYERFVDLWRAENFDAGRVLDLVAATGARYVVPTTKHHDGLTLWDAPGTGERNTVRRGPRRDLVAEFREAALARGVRFGVYYSGGLDWHFDDLPPITRHIDGSVRPLGRAYADYAFDHVLDLIDRYQPAVLWNDIEWPDAGKTPGDRSLVELFEHFYATVSDGVVNDRWGATHSDFRTSEYLHGLESETAGAWEHCRGIGFSFGHNRLEDASHHLGGSDLVRHFLDVVSRGGNLLLNVGLTAAGEVPPLQEAVLRELAAFTAQHGGAIFGSRPLQGTLGATSEEPWVRWTASGNLAHAFVGVDAQEASLPVDPALLDVASLTAVGVTARLDGDRVVVGRTPGMPGRIGFRRR